MIDKIRRDTATNWAKAKNFIPKNGEVILYDFPATSKIKIGDGVTPVNQLSFAEEEAMPISNIDRVEDEIMIMEKK